MKKLNKNMLAFIDFLEKEIKPTKVINKLVVKFPKADDTIKPDWIKIIKEHLGDYKISHNMVSLAFMFKEIYDQLELSEIANTKLPSETSS